MNDHQQPTTDERPQFSVTVSLQDIYRVSCPKCRDTIIALLASQAQGKAVEHALRCAFEGQTSPPPALPSEESPESPD